MPPTKRPDLSKRAIKKAIQAVVDEIPASVERMRQDAEDKRCLRGKYTPETGKCRVCHGIVEGAVRFYPSNRIGGPPGSAYVAHWACSTCGVMYDKPPKETV